MKKRARNFFLTHVTFFCAVLVHDTCMADKVHLNVWGVFSSFVYVYGVGAFLVGFFCLLLFYPIKPMKFRGLSIYNS